MQAVSKTAGIYTFNLLKEYVNTNYVIIGCFSGNAYNGDFSGNRCIFANTASTFKIEVRGTTGQPEAWRANGYTS